MENKNDYKSEVAILMATYNGENYLEQQLDSLINQTYKCFRCYIHDDESTDGTKGILDDYSNRYPDRIEIINGEKCGGSKENFLFLLKNVEAEYYFFCDQDDVWIPEKVEMCMEILKKNPTSHPMMIYTDLFIVDKELTKLNSSFYEYADLNPHLNNYKQLLMSNVCVGCTMAFNKSIRDVVVNIDSDNILMHDWEVALIASVFGELYYLDVPTILYRQHSNNVLGAGKEKRAFQKVVRIIKEKGYIERQKYYRNRPILMAKDLLKLTGIDNEKRDFLQEFSIITKKNKVRRILFYKKNKLYRQRINKIWQLINV